MRAQANLNEARTESDGVHLPLDDNCRALAAVKIDRLADFNVFNRQQALVLLIFLRVSTTISITVGSVVVRALQ